MNDSEGKNRKFQNDNKKIQDIDKKFLRCKSKSIAPTKRYKIQDIDKKTFSKVQKQKYCSNKKKQDSRY